MNLEQKRFEIRADIVRLVHRGKAGHIGGDLSVCDILISLFYKHMNLTPANVADAGRDRFLLSKGHSVESLYCVLADCGFFPKADLQSFSTFGTKYIGHPTNKIPGIEMNSGSLGHGLPVAVGMALAGKMDGADYRVYTVMGDGELAEGSVWEGFMSAAHHQLDHLTAVIDRNGLQISGTTEDVMSLENLSGKLTHFGWHVLCCNGNNLTELDAALTQAKAVRGKPSVIIANTTKGSGVSFMEHQAGWHHRVPTDEEFVAALAELAEQEAAANGE